MPVIKFAYGTPRCLKTPLSLISLISAALPCPATKVNEARIMIIRVAEYSLLNRIVIIIPVMFCNLVQFLNFFGDQSIGVPGARKAVCS